jgi:hypothetical protein
MRVNPGAVGLPDTELDCGAGTGFRNVGGTPRCKKVSLAIEGNERMGFSRKNYWFFGQKMQSFSANASGFLSV